MFILSHGINCLFVGYLFHENINISIDALMLQTMIKLFQLMFLIIFFLNFATQNTILKQANWLNF